MSLTLSCFAKFLKPTRKVSYNISTRCYSQKLGKNHYEVLGLPKTASKRQIRAAYLQLSKQYHPDANPGQEGTNEQFHKIVEAYEVLGNFAKKQEYDYTLLRRENVNLPRTEDTMSQFYKDGTIYTGPEERKDTGFTNGQMVIILLLVALTASIAQVLRVSAWAKSKAEGEEAHQDKLANSEKVFLSRGRLLQQLAQAKEAQKRARDKTQSDPESLIDNAPSG
ncbi:uncharacterized protein [Watersipora subatra]|uniref:uncharacterized protein n=1 Tax=Watersipora subatra TaxID=2589382 RepID=UPI00355C691A